MCVNVCKRVRDRQGERERERERECGGEFGFRPTPFSCCMFQLRSHSHCLCQFDCESLGVWILLTEKQMQCRIRATQHQFQGNFFVILLYSVAVCDKCGVIIGKFVSDHFYMVAFCVYREQNVRRT